MATVSKISVSKGVTVSVGKYESVRIDAHIELTAEKGDDEETLFSTAFTMVDDQVNAQIKELQDVVEPNSVFKAAAEEPKTAPTTGRRRS